jgi:processive 1,2-diacylglycerol beta-glucosyltransferase
MKKILILTAGFDDGHHAAARNLRDAIESLDEDARAEIFDLFADGRGAFSTLFHKTCLSLAQYAPILWNGLRAAPDETAAMERSFGGFARMHDPLEKILLETQPDCVVSTSPAYGHLIQKIFRSHRERPFKFITVVTESLSASPAWFRAPGDFFCVANETVADSLRVGGVPGAKIKVLGFPVSPEFTRTGSSLSLPAANEARRVLYLVHSGKKKTGKAVDRLLEQSEVHVTVVAGRDAELRAKLLDRFRGEEKRVQILGWTNQLPELLRTHHLVIAKSGLAVHEAVAAHCPIIVNHFDTSQEEANAKFVEKSGIGAVVEKNREAAEAVEQAFDKRAEIWQDWRRNLKKISRPDAALRIGELILGEIENDQPSRKHAPSFEMEPSRVMRLPQRNGNPPHPNPLPHGGRGDRNGNGETSSNHSNSLVSSGETKTGMLLCDFHIHSNYSDGKLSVPEIIDFYGERGFDCICITDHLADPRRLLGKISELANLTLGPEQVAEYFAVIERERQRAWRRYQMLVMTGIEFNKDGYTSKTSAHLLGVDLKSPIDAALDIPETIAQIHAQGALAIASHPHIMKSEWGKNTLYLWENQEKFAPLIDAWEIANRNNIFNDIGLKRLPFIANSDFHKPKHIYSWKTLIHCEKDPEAIKQCIRRNEHVAITLYRDFTPLPDSNAKGSAQENAKLTIAA